MPLNFGSNLFGGGIFKRSPNDDQVMTSAGSRQVPADQTVDTDTTYVDSDFNHDALTNFDAAKHKAWAASIAENIHGDNYTDTGDTTYTAGTGVALAGTEFTSDDANIVHDSLSGFNVDKHREWAASIAQNVHANNYTDTQPNPVQALIDVSATETTEETEDGLTFVTKKTIVFTPDESDNIPLLLKVVCEMKGSAGADSKVRITGDLGISAIQTEVDSGAYHEHTFLMGISDLNFLPGSSYTINVQLRGTNFPALAYLKDTTITLYYLDNTITTVDGAKWGEWS